MRFTFTITVQFGSGPELCAFRSDAVRPDEFSAILRVAQATVCTLLSAMQIRGITVREYLGSTLLATLKPDGLHATDIRRFASAA